MNDLLEYYMINQPKFLINKIKNYLFNIHILIEKDLQVNLLKNLNL